MFRRLLMVFVVLWLPLQGVVAAVMPFCKHAMTEGKLPGTPRTQESDAVEQSRHTHHAPGNSMTHSAHTEHPSEGSLLVMLACDNCDACHLACATFVPAQHNTVSYALAHVYRPYFSSYYSLLAPEQLLHPPKQSFA
ncbi:MAG: hypothetical protein ACKVQA_26040 [Burkholderiales bacterium]